MTFRRSLLADTCNDTAIDDEHSESENKAQFCNFMIFLSLIFYVKSIHGILEFQNLPFYHIDRLENNTF